MHITFFIGGLSGGGAERVTCNLANYMKEKGYQVEILTMADDTPSYPLSKDIKRRVLLRDDERKSFFYNSILRLYRFFKFLRHTESEVVVVMLPVTTIMLLQLKWLTKAKVIAAERSLPSIYTQKEQKQLLRLAPKADGWVFQTEGQKDWYVARGLKNCAVIPNAINPAFLNEEYLGERNKDIVTVGSLTVPKNHELLISSFAKIADKYKDFRLVIYGKGVKLDILQRLAEELGVDDRVVFAGYSTNVSKSIKASALFVLSSNYEGMPNALMEAMALGIPCVSTDCDGGGARFLVENEKNGLLVPKGDADALAAAMERMLSNHDFAEQCGREAHKICERLAPEKIYGEWEQFIREVVDKQ